jgi:hypothetical protein
MTRWHYGGGPVIGTFGGHNFSLKWTFGEMIFTGPNSGAAWGLSQVVDAYKGIAELLKSARARHVADSPPITILNGTAAHISSLANGAVDLVCMDPPYYDNVQYGELSDYFYVWQKRTLSDLYPELFTRRLMDKSVEAVANPARDGSAKAAKLAYEQVMGQIFAECRRVLKDNGLMTLMFTHKSQEAWEALTRSLIEAGWMITASFPVESEAAESIHQKNTASAASSIFLSWRKRVLEYAVPALWTGLAGQGVQQQIRQAVKEALVEFAPLRLTPVDEMVAAYGRALRVLSQQWPVMDGDESVGPIRAMNEASRVVAEHRIARITRGRLAVDDLDPETAMALTLYGIWGVNAFSYDEALNLSRSLNIALSARPAGYRVEGRMIGINHDFYIPALQRSVHYDRVAGYFRSTSLAAASQGFSAFVGRHGRMRLIVGADLDPDDVRAILQGDEVQLTSLLNAELEQTNAWPEGVCRGVKLLAWMVAHGHLDVRVAFRVHTSTGEPLAVDSLADGYVHMKWAIFADTQGNRLYASGSLNESRTALSLNAENIDVHCDWQGEDARQRVEEAGQEFEILWQDQHSAFRVLTLPEAVRQRLISLAADVTHPTEIDGSSAAPRTVPPPSALERLRFALLRDGPKLPGGRYVGLETAPITPWPHQTVVARRLIATWPYSYLLCDEVGLGKTIEAGLAIRSLYLSGLVTRVLICAPASLARQWQREMASKFLLPFGCALGGSSARHEYPVPNTRDTLGHICLCPFPCHRLHWLGGAS